MILVESICKEVLVRIGALGYEKKGSLYCESLVFPNKSQASTDKTRISEQELRLLFIEEFKKFHPDLLYSIETPTEMKYRIGKSFEHHTCDKSGQSTLIDLCVLERGADHCKRIFNIEFKHKNCALKNISKDILKLICEKQNGAFIQLLKNTDSGTLCNSSNTGVFDKLRKSFTSFGANWEGDNKAIYIVILSMQEQILIHRKILQSDLEHLDQIFFNSQSQPDERQLFPGFNDN